MQSKVLVTKNNPRMGDSRASSSVQNCIHSSRLRILHSMSNSGLLSRVRASVRLKGSALAESSSFARSVTRKTASLAVKAYSSSLIDIPALDDGKNWLPHCARASTSCETSLLNLAQA